MTITDQHPQDIFVISKYIYIFEYFLYYLNSFAAALFLQDIYLQFIISLLQLVFCS